ncbi:MAG: isoprenylcysteine carboxylmethyltransferase family protein [Proteobacteria bacterium]|nr:isoprenylcysteine carboxylmethyltransferase family protein [Pseudomonadota bacterium]
MSETPDDHDNDHAHVIIPPPIAWIICVGIGFGLDYLLALPFIPESAQNVWIGVGIFALGFILIAVATFRFASDGADVRPETPTDVVVTSGVYRYSRNPIYLGMVIAMIGAAIGINSLWVLIALVPFYIVINYGVVAREESYLEAKFGEEYLAYKASVRRWI